MKTKICTKCGKEKSLNEFSQNGRGKLRSCCKKCASVNFKLWESKNSEKRKAYRKKYYRQNRDKITNELDKWRLENKEKVNEQRKRNNTKKVNNVTDRYIKELFRRNFNLRFEYITDKMINIKREQIETLRLIKEIKNDGRIDI